jgi:ADP-ribose pyrophosphatase YjhB (NUDIX family)
MIKPLFTLGVVGVLYRENQVLLVRTEYNGKKWQFPGGYVEKGESIEYALRREINEELGVEAKLLNVVGTYIHELARNINIALRIDLPIQKIKIDGQEVLEARLFNENDLPFEASVRTRRILQDAVNGQQSKVVIFHNNMDKGNILGEISE